MTKRIFDIVLSLTGILMLLPFWFLLSLAVLIGSRGPVFYIQQRVGKKNQDFGLFKFRTMHVDSDKKGLLTVGNKDNRITKTGGFLRKYKLDELPQLLNVLLGDMSLVGPRPEVRKYVDMYDQEQIKVLDVQPGITDYASIEFIDENSILGESSNPEQTYIDEIMPAKIKLNLKYVQQKGLVTDVKIIFLTLKKIVS